MLNHMLQSEGALKCALNMILGTIPSFYEIPDSLRLCGLFEPVGTNPLSKIGMTKNTAVFQSVQMSTRHVIVYS